MRATRTIRVSARPARRPARTADARSHEAHRIARRPARSARRWRPHPLGRTRPVSGGGPAALRTSLLLGVAVFAVLVLFPLLLALAGMPYR